MSSLLTTRTIQNSIWTGIQIILFEFGQVGPDGEGRLGFDTIEIWELEMLPVVKIKSTQLLFKTFTSDDLLFCILLLFSVVVSETNCMINDDCIMWRIIMLQCHKALKSALL